VFVDVDNHTTYFQLGGIQYTHEHIEAAELAAAFTEQEKNEIYEMVNDRNIEKNLIDSLFPGIYGMFSIVVFIFVYC
jgi:DNA replicative helicase MCM subunit Mcm2 (Cdc46/Mcm family)